ncbi:hypothetical protein [Shewanella baltica]|uniref:hypothetical protein n=1 Tax=Shewanella baltica TaxID=62322 RepID=UPI00216A6447|nr:hypothetical protein [Shewanella baltica]MCS6116906.1 hypothetical protein [Shewanella baltica]UVW66508.1 hypothetical protein HHE93_23540 [Shewanella baltica]
MRIKQGGGKWLLVALLSGSIAGGICIFVGIPQFLANVIPFGVSAAVFYAARSQWLQ